MLVILDIQMIPIYQAIIAEEEDLPGGTTRPILVTVQTPKGLDKYVVKIFDTAQQPNYFPLSNEVYGSILASQFDIPTPEIALISLQDDLIQTLKHDIKQRVLKCNPKLFFGSKYHDGYIQYVPSKNNTSFNLDSIEIIFALDVLLRNVDRRIGKSNLLVKKGSYLAIDHELCFHIDRKFTEYNTEDWSFINRHRIHIFRSRLQKNIVQAQFSVIQEYIRAMDIGAIAQAASFLQKNNLNPGNLHLINLYLSDVKTNVNKFIHLCKLLIV